VEAGVDGEVDLCAAERGKGLADGNRFGFLRRRLCVPATQGEKGESEMEGERGSRLLCEGRRKIKNRGSGLCLALFFF